MKIIRVFFYVFKLDIGIIEKILIFLCVFSFILKLYNLSYDLLNAMKILGVKNTYYRKIAKKIYFFYK